MTTQVVLFLLTVAVCILTDYVADSFVGVVGSLNHRQAGVLMMELERGRSSLTTIKSKTRPTIDSSTALHVNKINEDGKEEEEDVEVGANTTFTATRETELGRMSQGIARTGMKDMQNLEAGDIVVAKFEIPSLNIWIDSGYEIMEIYSQGVNMDTGMIEKIELESLSANVNNKVGYTTYLKLYSPKYHTESGPVIVTPDEIGLITIKDELIESLWLALPGFFWVIVAATFASNYNDKYGGSFINAVFRT